MLLAICTLEIITERLIDIFEVRGFWKKIVFMSKYKVVCGVAAQRQYSDNVCSLRTQSEITILTSLLSII